MVSLDKVRSAADVQSSLASKRWVTLAFTWNGLRALGLDEESLASFPEEFKQGMAARAEMLGDTGFNHPDQWVGGLASPDLHAIAILFARDGVERARSLPSTRTSSRGVMASRSCHRWNWRRLRQRRVRPRSSDTATGFRSP